MPRSKHNTTSHRVSIFTHALLNNRLDLFDGDGATSLVGLDYGDDLGQGSAEVTIMVKPYKTTDVPAGTRGVPWVDLVHEGDWFGIDVVKNGRVVGLTFGRIDTVQVQMSADGNGAPVGTILLQGRSASSILQDTPIYFNPHDPTTDNVLGINMQAILDQVEGTPAQLCTNMVRGLMGGGGVDPILGGHTEVPVGITGSTLGQRWVDSVDFTTCVNDELRGTAFAVTALSPEGAPSVWDFVSNWRNTPLNELFFDVDPTAGYPKRLCLILRERPFVNTADGDQSPWNELVTWYVDVSTLASVDLSRGANRVNHVTLAGDLAASLPTDNLALYPPVANIKSIRRYGLHKLDESTNYQDERGPSAFVTESRDWLSLIVSWNALNHEYWQGSLTLGELRPEIRVGQRLALVGGPVGGYLGLEAGGSAKGPDQDPDAGSLTFYVEAVRHTSRAGQHPTARTTLTVSRGYIEGSRVADMEHEHAEFGTPRGSGAVTTGVDLNVLPRVDARTLDPAAADGVTVIS